MIHYHGLPITPARTCVEAISGGHAFVSHAHHDQIAIAADVCQSFALDNGAFSAWKQGRPITDWSAYFEWVAQWHRHPAFDFAVVPDDIEGDENAQQRLIAMTCQAWHWDVFDDWAPVWHMHESTDRLKYLCAAWKRVCIGSSGDYAVVGTRKWWARMNEAMSVACDDKGRPRCKLHGLRMLDTDVYRHLPLSSADSTNIGRNVGIDSHWKGSYQPPEKHHRAYVMRARIESFQSAPTWEKQWQQHDLLS